MSAIGVWACSQGDPQPPYIPDPPKSDASSSGGDAKADVVKPTCLGEDGGCNNLLSCGSKIFIVEVAQDPPSGQGGVVVDGTYVLTDFRDYTGADGGSGQQNAYIIETMSFVTGSSDAGSADGATSQTMVWEDNASSNSNTSPSTTSGVADFTGANFTITHTCPNSSVIAGTFTASSSQLILFVPEGSGIGQLTYTKQ